MNSKHKYRINIQWSQDDNCYLVALPDLSQGQQWVTHGDTYQEALNNALDAMDELICVAEQEGKIPPVPQLETA